MRASSFAATRLALPVVVFASSLVGLAVACSSSTERATITDDSGTTPTPVPTQTDPPKGSSGGPVDTSGDAALEADAPDNCKRASPGDVCGLVEQCGCTLAETCDVQDNDGGVGCVTAGLAVMGAPCVATSGCARGLTCVFGTCHAYCDNPGGACTTARTDGCQTVTTSGSDAGVPKLDVCRAACDLRDVASCGGTTAAGTGVCVEDGAGNTDCAKGGTAAAGAACSPTNECGPGLVCAGNTTSGNTCLKWCRVGTTDCGGTVACNSFAPKVLVGGVEYAGCP